LNGKILRDQSNGLEDQVKVLHDIQKSLKDAKESFHSLCRDVGSQGSMQQAEMAQLEQTGQAILCASWSAAATRYGANLSRMSSLHSYKLLERLCTAIPAQVLRQQPVMFRDALDRVAPIHLEWINSREAFMAVLKVRFKDFGLHKIQNGEFALQDTGSADDIDLSDISRPWDLIFVPGQQVDMSVTFKRRDQANSILCPACSQEHLGQSSEVDITW